MRFLRAYFPRDDRFQSLNRCDAGSDFKLRNQRKHRIIRETNKMFLNCDSFHFIRDTSEFKVELPKERYDGRIGSAFGPRHKIVTHRPFRVVCESFPCNL